jgi:alpha-ketoglutarate-dependent taurine dioxygenase
MLHAKVIRPADGDTEYADTRAAYDALPDAMKRRLDKMSVESASSIQIIDSDDSIVSCQRDAADFFDSIGQGLP